MSVNYVNAKRQRFSFCYSFMDYLVDNVTPKATINLFKSCKFLSAKLHRQITFIRNLDMYIPVKEVIVDGYDIALPPNNDGFEYLSDKNKLWITGSLDLGDLEIPSQIFTKIVRCDLTELNISFALTVTEFKFLTKSQTISRLGIYDASVINADKSVVPVEEICQQLPKLRLIMYVIFFVFSFQKRILVSG